MIKSYRTLLISAVMIALFACTSHAGASTEFKSVARLFGSLAVKGKAVYEEKLKSGTTMQKFKVELQHGQPGKSYKVRVNGRLAGSITINTLGRGSFQLRTAQFIDSPGDGQPIPAWFPRLDTGNVVTVGSLVAGVFFDSSDNTAQRYKLEGELVGGGSAEGSVEYQEHFEDGGLEREFELEIEDAAPNQNFSVSVRGTVVGTIHTNNLGRGRLELRTPAFINDPGDGQPMPASFPSLKAGDIVKVGTMTATLAPAI